MRSLSSVIAERGGRMYDVLEQLSLDKQWAAARGLSLSVFQTPAAAPAPAADEPDAAEDAPPEDQTP
ncbi:hypothetical protein AB672_05735 [Xylella taiwanensis]|nr:hypothetical protein AB672_05735 [Xylella taiwanensis]